MKESFKTGIRNGIRYGLARLQEKNSWAGIGLFLGGLGVFISPKEWEIISVIGTGGITMLMMFWKENPIQPRCEDCPLSRPRGKYPWLKVPHPPA